MRTSMDREMEVKGTAKRLKIDEILSFFMIVVLMVPPIIPPDALARCEIW